jgi:hypothetical protein
MSRTFSQKLQFKRRDQFGFALLALWLAGCASIPSKMWVATDSALNAIGPARDSFSWGERPVVYIQGFEGTHEVALELSRDGKKLPDEKFPLHSGETKIHYGESHFEAAPVRGWIEERSVTQVVNNGDKVLLGKLPPGNYEVSLKTNETVIATCSFKVTWPPDLETERQAIESQRQKFQADSDNLQKLRSEIDSEKSTIDQHDTAAVNAFNEKVRGYNELSKNYNSSKAEFDARVHAFNDRISTFGGSTP